jgi:predicted membrane metal-binding protein
LMLLYNPYFLPYDLGFLLSFWAFIGIVIFNEILDKFRIKYEKFYDKLRKNFVGRALYKSFREYILPTIWATVWVLPILLLFVGKINLLWMLANFLVVFLVPVVSILWIFTLFFPIDILIWLENKFLSYINFISYWFSKHQINLYIKGWPIKLFIFVLVYLVLAVLYFYFTKRFLKDE